MRIFNVIRALDYDHIATINGKLTIYIRSKSISTDAYGRGDLNLLSDEYPIAVWIDGGWMYSPLTKDTIKVFTNNSNGTIALAASTTLSVTVVFLKGFTINNS